MESSFPCSCGETLSVPSAYRGSKLFCFRCRRSAWIPGREPAPQAVPRKQTSEIPAAAPASSPASKGGDIEGVGGTGVPAGRAVSPPSKGGDAEGVGGTGVPAGRAVSPPSKGGDTEGGIPLRGERAAAPADAPKSPAKPPSGKLEETPTIEVDAPAHFEWVLLKGGKEFWKLTCVCGKRLLSPAPSSQPYGTCPKCQRRLQLPGYADGAEIKSAPAATDLKAEEDELREDRETSVALPLKKTSEPKINLLAAKTAAARLRPNRPSTRSAARRTASGRISAWPLAGRFRRLLAAFIDLSFSTCVAGAVMVVAGPHALEPLISPLPMLLGLVLLTLTFNDSVVNLIWGGSLGKTLVVLVVRTSDGEPCGVLRALFRAVLKWLFIPGWLLGLFDSTERALHDLVCGTVVMRGRRHKG